jgi:hypothetical protein
MSDPDRRKKMISLRLSEVDYETLKKQYRTYGARNVSELARLALQRMMAESPRNQDTVATKLAELEGRVHALESQLHSNRVFAVQPQK